MSVPSTDPVRAALTEIRDRVFDEEWWDSRGVCEHPFHTTHYTKHEEGQERCPRCFSSWWSTDGSLPGGPQYAMEAVAYAALAAEREPVEITDEMIERAKSIRTFGLKCTELRSEEWAAVDGLHEFIWVEDLPDALSAAFSEARTEEQKL